MLLRADSIGLSKPGTELRINLRGRHQAEVVDMVSGRDRFDSAEAWTRHSAGEHHVTIEPAMTRCDLGERHPHLKRNTRLLREDDDRATSGDCTSDGVEEQADGGILALKVVGQVVPAAGMRLIAVGEATLAIGTGPKWPTVPLHGAVILLLPATVFGTAPENPLDSCRLAATCRSSSHTSGLAQTLRQLRRRSECHGPRDWPGRLLESVSPWSEQSR